MRGHHIILVGFMGSGKTTIGQLLAKRLRRRFVDLDDCIEGTVGKSIAAIFADEGEDYFRNLETRCLGDLLSKDLPPAVIALGGGAFPQQRNRDAITHARAVTVFLECPLETLRERCVGLLHRPLAQNATWFTRLHGERLPLYRQADFTVDTGTGTPQEGASAIAEALSNVL